MKSIELDHVSFSYGGSIDALADVSFSVDEHEKVAIIGPNGAGKSTLLHLLAGFRMPFRGSVRIRGEELRPKNADDLRKMVGILFQDPDDQLFMPTVAEDVAFGPRNLSLPDVDERVRRALDDAGIGNLALRRPHELSQGMKKRVAVAGIMAMDPHVLLLDEPTSGLDPRSRKELIRLLKGMDRPMVVATHDIEAAAELADRAIVLDVGVVMQGPVREVLEADALLLSSGLETPSVSKVLKALRAIGFGNDQLPTTLDEALDLLVQKASTGAKDARGCLSEERPRKK